MAAHIELVDYLSTLKNHWDASAVAFVLAALWAVHGILMSCNGRYKAYFGKLGEKLSPSQRIIGFLLLLLSGTIYESYSIWQEDQKIIYKKTVCAPQIQLKNREQTYDNENKLSVVKAIYLVVHQSIRKYGISFQTHGGQGQAIWASTQAERPKEFSKKDVPRIQLQPEGMAHFLYMPEGGVVVSVWARDPKKVTFSYKVKCFSGSTR